MIGCYRLLAYALNLWFLAWLTPEMAAVSGPGECSFLALGPLAIIGIGAGLGALAGGVTAHQRDNNVLGGALGGALLGGATGGLGSALLGGGAAAGGLSGVLSNAGRVLGGSQLLGGLLGGGGGAAPVSAGSGAAGAGGLLTSPPFNPAATTGPDPTGIFTPPTPGTGVLPQASLPDPLEQFPGVPAPAAATAATGVAGPATAQAEEENFFQDLLGRLGGRLPDEMGGGRILTEAIGGALNRKELLDTLTEIENARRIRANLNVGVTPGGAAAIQRPDALGALGRPTGPVFRGGF